MSEKRFIRNIVGNIYDSENDKWFEEDWKGKPLDYDDDLIVFLNEQQTTIRELKEEMVRLHKMSIELMDRVIPNLRRENEQLRMKLKGDDYIMVSEILSNLRKTGICDGCKNKDKPVEWYLERGFSITGQICDRYEPEV